MLGSVARGEANFGIANIFLANPDGRREIQDFSSFYDSDVSNVMEFIYWELGFCFDFIILVRVDFFPLFLCVCAFVCLGLNYMGNVFIDYVMALIVL